MPIQISALSKHIQERIRAELNQLATAGAADTQVSQKTHTESKAMSSHFTKRQRERFAEARSRYSDRFKSRRDRSTSLAEDRMNEHRAATPAKLNEASQLARDIKKIIAQAERITFDAQIDNTLTTTLNSLKDLGLTIPNLNKTQLNYDINQAKEAISAAEQAVFSIIGSSFKDALRDVEVEIDALESAIDDEENS